MTLGPPIVYYPIWHPDFYGGPVGYRRVLFKHREPALFEAFRAHQRAIDAVVLAGRRFNG